MRRRSRRYVELSTNHSPAIKSAPRFWRRSNTPYLNQQQPTSRSQMNSPTPKSHPTAPILADWNFGEGNSHTASSIWQKLRSTHDVTGVAFSSRRSLTPSFNFGLSEMPSCTAERSKQVNMKKTFAKDSWMLSSDSARYHLSFATSKNHQRLLAQQGSSSAFCPGQNPC